MGHRKVDQGLTSRFEIKKSLGNYPPWRGVGVTDSLSEKNYLLFTLLPPFGVPVSIEDLQMRDHLFSRDEGIILSTLSLQKSDGGVTFLLPHAKLIPLKKALPSMKLERTLETLTTLVSGILKRLGSGLSFCNLSVESIVFADGSLTILPTAYLLPGEILGTFEEETHGDTRPVYGDLKCLGDVLLLFSRYLDPDIADIARAISKGLVSLGPESDGNEFFGLIDDLCMMVGLSREEAPVIQRTEPAYHEPETALRMIEDAAFRAKEGDKRLVIVRGRSGEGKTRFLDVITRKLTHEWGYHVGNVLSAQDIFSNAENLDTPDGADFVLIDDHHIEPLLCCHVIDRLCQFLEQCNLAVIAVDENPAGFFVDAIDELGQRKDLTVDEVKLEAVPASSRTRILAQLVPSRLAGKITTDDETDGSFAFANFRLRAHLQGEKAARKKSGSWFVDCLSREERSVLNFLAVFRFEVPLRLLESIYSTGERSIHETLHKLSILGLIRARVETSILAGNSLCLVYSLSARTLSRAVTESIPVSRRKQIHRSIVLLLKEIKNTPSLYIFYHLAGSGNRADAAMKGYELFQMLLRRRNLCAINCFHESYLSERLDTHLTPDLRFRLLLDLGNYFSLIGKTAQAEALYRRCREKTSKEKDGKEHRTLAVEAVRRECEILEKKGEFQKAEKLLDKTLNTHGEHILSNERARLFNDLAWIHYRLGRFDKSWENCLLVHKLLDEKQHPLEIAQSYNLMGAINWNRSKYDDAIMCHKRCLELRKEAGDEIGTATSYNNLGLVYLSMGSINEALEAFKKSMTIKQSHNNLPGMAAAHLNIALAYLDMGNLTEAEENCLTASELAENIGNQQLLAETFGTLGEINFLQGDYDKAREYYFKDLHICNSTRSLREKAVVFRRLGELSLAEQKIAETRDLMSQAHDLNKKIGSRLETTLLNLLEGKVLLAEGKREAGRRRLEGASLELSLLGRKSKAAVTTSELGELYLEEGNEPLAREYLMRSISLVGEDESSPAQLRRLQDKLDRKSHLSLDEIHSDSQRFRALARIISLIRTIHNPDKLHRTITESARKITGMARAALILQSDGRDTFRILAASGGFAKGEILTDANIIKILEIARQLGYPLDISRTDIPLGTVDEKFLEQHPNIICTPLWIQDEVTGFLYLDSPRTGTGTTDVDHSFLVAFSQQIALGLERILLSDKVRHMEKPKPETPPPSPKSKERVTFQDIVGNSQAIRHIFELIDGIKDMDTTVLLTGPTGTGKDLIAKTIHHSSHRGAKVFHSLNCSNIPKDLIGSVLFGHEKGAFTGAHRQNVGFFESANGGTIFLNEIGDMPLEQQASLLRVLEEQKFYRVGGTKEITTDVRIIAATHQDLLQLVREGRFREDLYYRINIFPIRMPALRERREDIKLISNHFLTTYCRLYNIPVKKISPEAMMHLIGHDWPGNVRELENTINRSIIVSRTDTILPEDLPDDVVKHADKIDVRTQATLEDAVESLVDRLDLATGDLILHKVEGMLVKKVVDRIGDKTKAASMLGISKPTLYSKLRNNEKNH